MDDWGDSLLGVGARRVLLAISTLLLVALGTWLAPPAARAESCPNEPLRARQVHAMELPDCRAYEQVSPVDKNGVNAVGGSGVVQASPDGAGVTYASESPFPQATGSQGGPPFYLSARSLSPEEWSTFGLTPPTEPGPVNEEHENFISGSTEDLTKTIVVEEEQALAPGATPEKPNAYVRDNTTGAYQLLAGDLNPRKVYFADATPGGSRIIFEARSELSVSGGPKPAPGVTNLYEWDEAKALSERLSVVGVLPASEGGEAPTGGSHAGGPGATNNFSTRNTISQDGSRVFFTDAGTERIYMRTPHAEPAATIPISAGAASWQATTPSGSFVFYAEGTELYRFNVDEFERSAKPEPEALAEAREQLTTGAEGVETLGVSTNGAYSYFVAPGVLAANIREYQNSKGETVVEKAVSGARNLYQWQQGDPSPVFVAERGVENGSEGRGTRVSADGKTVLFASTVPLTDYPNGPNCEEGENLRFEPCNEYFRYAADTGRLSCVSCSPVQASARREPFMTKQDPALTQLPHQAVHSFLTRNLSDDGTRIFFETEEALVSEDENHQSDVYEWEAEGAGSCTSASPTFDAVAGGCLYLISTGQSGQTSYFADASADGSSVFFFTVQPLVGQDQDDNQDVYDARVAGGIAAQNPLAPSPCTGEACHGAPEGAPAFGTPASLSLSGTGNLVPPSPPPPKTCVKPKKLTHGKCMTPKRRCPKGRRLSHRRCVKARARRRANATIDSGERRGGGR
jgi:hypothetical protein